MGCGEMLRRKRAPGTDRRRVSRREASRIGNVGEEDQAEGGREDSFEVSVVGVWGVWVVGSGEEGELE